MHKISPEQEIVGRAIMPTRLGFAQRFLFVKDAIEPEYFMTAADGQSGIEVSAVPNGREFPVDPKVQGDLFAQSLRGLEPVNKNP